MLRALLVDDEPSANFWLSDLIHEVEGIEVVGAVYSVAGAKAFLQRNIIDVVFLDYEMPSSRGSELIPVLGEKTCVVMVTAHDTFAVQAFEFGVVDYILKPVKRDRLRLAAERIRSFILAKRSESASQAANPSGTVDLSPTTDEILWIEARRNESVYCNVRGDYYQALKSLADWEIELDSTRFQRIGRSYILNFQAISSVKWKLSSTTQVYFFNSPAILKLKRHPAGTLKETLLDSKMLTFTSNSQKNEDESSWITLKKSV
ncbi:MAG: LytTR family DNA-binding domain-containing protein [Planctomycetia bacterium]